MGQDLYNVTHKCKWHAHAKISSELLTMNRYIYTLEQEFYVNMMLKKTSTLIIWSVKRPTVSILIGNNCWVQQLSLEIANSFYLFIFYFISFLQWTWICILMSSHSVILKWQGSQRPSSWTTKTYLSYLVNIMTADDLAPSVTRASAATILTYFVTLFSIRVDLVKKIQRAYFHLKYTEIINLTKRTIPI